MKRHSTEEGFAHSMTDLMAGVAVTFLLLAAIFMVKAAKARDAERKRAEAAERETTKVIEDEPAKKQLDELRASLPKGVIGEVDPRDPMQLVILFETRDWFGPGECVPRESHDADIVRMVVPTFAQVCSRRSYIRSIILEGHTDRDAHCPSSRSSARCGAVDLCDGRDIEKGFANNVRLSAARAQEVFFKAHQRLAVDTPDLLRECIEPLFVVSGRGPVEPKDPARDWRAPQKDPNVLASDRRVVLKVRFQSPRPNVGTDAGAP